MSLVDKLASEGQLTAEQVERIGQNVSSFISAIENDPALRKEAMEKLCGFKSSLISAGKGALEYAPYALVSAGVGALIGGGAEAARSGVRSIRDSMAKGNAYRTMIEENPNLSGADPNMTEKAFNTLYRFNPEYAKDPLVAGTFVKNVIDQERLDIGTVSNLVGAHKNLADASRGPGLTDFFMKSMQGGEDFLDAREGARIKNENARARGAAEAADFAAEQRHRSEQAERAAEMHRERMRQENVNFNAAQRRYAAQEEAFRAEEAKRKFWENAEPKDSNDPRTDA